MAKPFWGLYDGLDTGTKPEKTETAESAKPEAVQDTTKRKLDTIAPTLLPRSKRVALGPAPRALVQRKNNVEAPKTAPLLLKQPVVVRKEEVCSKFANCR